jgi:hypothetical protein
MKFFSLFFRKRRTVRNTVSPRELENAALRRATREKLEVGLLPWNAPTLEKKRQIDHADLMSRELGMNQVRVLESTPFGFDRIIARRSGVIVDVMPYKPTGELFGGLS